MSEKDILLTIQLSVAQARKIEAALRAMPAEEVNDDLVDVLHTDNPAELALMMRMTIDHRLNGGTHDLLNSFVL